MEQPDDDSQTPGHERSPGTLAFKSVSFLFDGRGDFSTDTLRTQQTDEHRMFPTKGRTDSSSTKGSGGRLSALKALPRPAQIAGIHTDSSHASSSGSGYSQTQVQKGAGMPAGKSAAKEGNDPAEGQRGSALGTAKSTALLSTDSSHKTKSTKSLPSSLYLNEQKEPLSFPEPTHEEVKEFCLLTGGGFGAVHQKSGKFLIGAFDAELKEEIMSMGPVERSVSTRKRSLFKLKSQRHIEIPPKIQQGRLPRGSFPAVKKRGSGKPDHWHRVGALILVFEEPDLKDARVGAGALSVSVEVQPPTDVPPADKACLFVADDKWINEHNASMDKAKAHGHRPRYSCRDGVEGPARQPQAGKSRQRLCYPCSTSQIVGALGESALPRIPDPQPDDVYPWKWSQGKVIEHTGKVPGKKYCLEQIEFRKSTCMVEVPLLMETPECKVKPLAEKLELQSRLQAWALLHTLTVSVSQGGACTDDTTELHECLWQPGTSEDQVKKARGDPEQPGDGKRARFGSWYFKERPLDRDMARLHDLDDGLDDKLTCATGRLRWNSAWRRQRALYVMVTTPMHREHIGSQRMSLKESLQHIVRGAEGQDERQWSAKSQGETGFHHTSPHLLKFFVENVWRVSRPDLVLTITGGAQDFRLAKGMQDEIMKELVDVAKNMNAWVVTGGTDCGIMKLVGDAFEGGPGSSSPVPLFGIAPWGVVKGRQGLLTEPSNSDIRAPTETFPQDYEQCLEQWDQHIQSKKSENDCRSTDGAKPGSRKSGTVPINSNHTHFIFVNSGESENYNVEIPVRTAFEACVSNSSENYTGQILQKLEEQHLGWQGMNVQQMRHRLKVHRPIVPAVCVCIEGGPGTIHTVWEAARRQMPVVIVKETGRAADLLADVVDVFDPDIERQSRRCQMLQQVYEDFPFEGAECSGEFGRIEEVLDKYGIHLADGKLDEGRTMLKRCREAVETGRCIKVDCSEKSAGDLNKALLESILWGWGTDPHPDVLPRRRAEPPTPSGSRRRMPQLRQEMMQNENIRYSKDLFGKKLIVAVQWDRPDILKEFLDDPPPKSKTTYNVVWRGSDDWNKALNDALIEALVHGGQQQTEMVRILLDNGADLDIFRVNQRKLADILFKVPELKGLFDDPKGRKNDPEVSSDSERIELEDIFESPQVQAALRWKTLMAVRKQSQEARHVCSFVHDAKKNLIALSKKPGQRPPRYEDKGLLARAWARARTCMLPQYVEEDRHVMLGFASISKKLLHGKVQESDKRREEILLDLIKMSRTIVCLDRVYNDLLGENFRCKLGMMDVNWDLMLWSALMNRNELAEFFWERAPHPVISALTVVHLHRASAAHVRLELQGDVESHVDKFEKMAVDVQQYAMNENVRAALRHLESPSHIWGGWTGYDLAVMAGRFSGKSCRVFVSKCCIQANEERWSGDMEALAGSAVIRVAACFAFIPLLWVFLTYKFGFHLGSEPNVSECFPALGGKASVEPWSIITVADAEVVLGCMTLGFFLLFLLSPWTLTEFTGMPGILTWHPLVWRPPPTTESLRAPGQRRSIPAGYPEDPFGNSDLVRRYSYLIAKETAKTLYQGQIPDAKINRMSYQWVTLRIGLAYLLYRSKRSAEDALGLLLVHLRPKKGTRDEPGPHKDSEVLTSKDQSRHLSQDVHLVFDLLSDEKVSAFTRSIAPKRQDLEMRRTDQDADAPEADFSHLEAHLAKQASRSKEAKFIKFMQTLRKEPDAWQKMANADLNLLWSPSFGYFERLSCLSLAPASLFLVAAVHFLVFVLVFSMLVCWPAYREPLDVVPWEESYVLLNMVCFLIQELFQMKQSGLMEYLLNSNDGFWNILDVISQTVFWVGVIVRHIVCRPGYCSKHDDFFLWNCASSPPLIPSCDVEQSMDGMCGDEQMYQGYKGYNTWAFSHQLYAVTCGLQWLRMLYIYSAQETLGSLVLAIFRLGGQIGVFVCIVIVCVTGFGIMLHGGRTITDCPSSDDPHGLHGQCLSAWWWVRTYFAGYGELSLDEIQDAISLFILVLAALILQLVLMNTVFVAVITSKFDEMMELANQEFRISQYHNTEDFIKLDTTVPVPFNVIMSLYNLIFEGRAWRDAEIRKIKRQEIEAGLLPSKQKYLRSRLSNRRFRNLPSIPIELKMEIEQSRRKKEEESRREKEEEEMRGPQSSDAKKKPGKDKTRGWPFTASAKIAPASSMRSSANDDSADPDGSPAGKDEKLQELAQAEKDLKLYILSLKPGEALIGRAKDRYIREAKKKQDAEDRMVNDIGGVKEQLTKMDDLLLSLFSKVEGHRGEGPRTPLSGNFSARICAEH